MKKDIKLIGEVITNMQMCNLFAELTSDVEGMKAKLNFPYYKRRESDVEIKEYLDEIIELLADEGREACDQARAKLNEVVD